MIIYESFSRKIKRRTKKERKRRRDKTEGEER